MRARASLLQLLSLGAPNTLTWCAGLGTEADSASWVITVGVAAVTKVLAQVTAGLYADWLATEGAPKVAGKDQSLS